MIINTASAPLISYYQEAGFGLVRRRLGVATLHYPTGDKRTAAPWWVCPPHPAEVVPLNRRPEPAASTSLPPFKLNMVPRREEQ
ncbi:hypothetical protein Vqi01_49790 [Micromonospora qiuiae]|uniref:N-acetyltransferase domain-containing protein n=1 Tax=Micromonospora qiuiae TaxID=502268 RepID=A0ABQ4JJT5_9ACTN|nr:hypothetical protein Vqi01_49790 [Micromonospora qiuiae]